MGKKYLFVTTKNQSRKKIFLGVAAIIAVAFIGMNVSNYYESNSTKAHQAPIEIQLPQVQEVPTGNNFIGLNTSQDQGERILSLQFTALKEANIYIKDSAENLVISVDTIKNIEDYKDIKYLMNNFQLETQGNTMTFTLDKNQITSRYLIGETEKSIDIKLLSKTLEGKRITIDPGHGGIDSGAIGPTGLTESEVVLPVALRLEELLQEAGAEVVLTRYTEDRALPNYREDQLHRIEVARELDSHLFISIHNNGSVHRSAHGIEVLYHRGTVNNYQSLELAKTVQKHLVGEFQRRDRGVIHKSIIQLTGETFTSVLAEILFITNNEEEKMLRAEDFTERAAQSLFLAIKDYFQN